MIKAAALRQVQAQVVANASGVVQANTSSLPPSLLSIPTSFPPPAVSYNVPPPNMVPTNLPPPALNQTVGVPVVVGTAVPNMSLPPPSASQQNAPPTSSSTTSTPVNGIIGMTPTPRGVFVKYVTPNPLTFVLEPSTGYFVDPLTKFYYDAKTSYYFNNDTRQWCYWDQTYSTYFPVEENAPTATSASTTLQPAVDPSMPQVIHMSSVEEKKRDDEKPQKSASDIAKEMMKWAKKQEKAKVHMSLKPLVKPLETKSVLETVASGCGSNADADLTYKMLEKSKNPLANMSDDSDEEQPFPDAVRQHARIENSSDDKSATIFFKGNTVNATNNRDAETLTPAPQRHVPSAQEQREMMERALIDESKKMCLLCKRAFPSVDVLRKHVEKSDLHRKNLEDKRVEWGKQYVASLMAGKMGGGAGYTQPEPQAKVVYRDRAKERRQTYGLDAGGYAHSGGSEFGRSEETIRRESELAARRPIEENNIGSKLLKSMGWREGQGVGKNAQGIVNPIEAERRVEGAGLGASGSRILHGAEASHKERVRATFYNRYREME